MRNGKGKGKDNDGDIGAPRQNDPTNEVTVPAASPSTADPPSIEVLTADLRTAVLKVPNPVQHAYLRRP